MIGNEKQIASDVITIARKLQNCLAMYNTANPFKNVRDYYYKGLKKNELYHIF